MYPWQEKLADAVSNGIGAGEITVMTSGRSVGKSTYSQVVKEWNEMLRERIPYKTVGSSTVDGVAWYTVKCNSKVAEWIRQQPRLNRWYEHRGDGGAWYVVGDVFDVHEALYLQIGLKFEAVESY